MKRIKLSCHGEWLNCLEDQLNPKMVPFCFQILWFEYNSKVKLEWLTLWEFVRMCNIFKHDNTVSLYHDTGWLPNFQEISFMHYLLSTAIV